MDVLEHGAPESDGKRPDRATRQAALWATLVAVPLTALVAVLVFVRLSPDDRDGAGPAAPSPTAARPVSTAPVDTGVRPLADRPAAACRALLSRLPAKVRDLPQRPVQAGPEQNAAYGDPAIVVNCGVAPPTIRPGEDGWVVNGVCWYATKPADGVTVLTTVDREVPVQVTMPSVYAPPLQWTVPFSDAVSVSVRSLRPAPAGCVD